MQDKRSAIAVMLGMARTRAIEACLRGMLMILMGVFALHAQAGNLSGIKSIHAINTGACMVMNDDTVRCAYDSELQDGASGYQYAHQINGLINAKSVSGYHRFACAVINDGTVQCWGTLNDKGQLGRGTTDPDTSPATQFHPAPVTGLTGVSALANAGSTCALLNDGTVKCWGPSLGSVASYGAQPVAIPGISGAIRIGGGNGGYCALINDGTVKCWSDDVSNPLVHTVAGVSGARDLIAANGGADQYCAVQSDGKVICWTSWGNFFGELATGSSGPVHTPTTATEWNTSAAGFSKLTLGHHMAYAVYPDGSVKGAGFSNWLGNGNQSSDHILVPVVIQGVNNAIALTSSGTTCALLMNSEAQCWSNGTPQYVQAPPSNGPALANLQIDSVSLSPVFSANTKTYSASVSNSVGTIIITPTVAGSATVKVNGNAVASGNGAPVALNAGSNTITVLVTSQDGTMSTTYTITVTRGTPTPATPIEGACGRADGIAVTSAPGSDLCKVGDAVNLVSNGSWSWECAGRNGGSNASCIAPLKVALASANGSDGTPPPPGSITPATLSLPGNGSTVYVEMGSNNLLEISGSGRIQFAGIASKGAYIPLIQSLSGKITLKSAAGKALIALGDQVLAACAGSGSTVLEAQMGSNNARDIGVVSGCLALPDTLRTSTKRAISLADNKLLAGETVSFDGDNQVSRLRAGTISDSSLLIGDKLAPVDPSIASIMVDAKQPNLDGSSIRLGKGKTLKQRFLDTAGLDASQLSQNQWGVYSLKHADAIKAKLPETFRITGDVLIDTSVPDGFDVQDDGRIRFSAGGYQLALAPAVNQPYRIVTQAHALGFGNASVQNDGSYTLSQNGGLKQGGTEYRVRPVWQGKPDSRIGLIVEANGELSYNDQQQSTVLVPAPANLDALKQAVFALDAKAKVQVSIETGIATLTIKGNVFKLKPGFALSKTPSDKLNQAWWLNEQAQVVINNGDGSSQAFTVVQ